jgi:hypothetical protein
MTTIRIHDRGDADDEPVVKRWKNKEWNKMSNYSYLLMTEFGKAGKTRTSGF